MKIRGNKSSPPRTGRGIKGEVSKDHLTRARRSWNMSRIRGKNTAPEMVVRSMLHKMGYRFRLHVKILVPESVNFPSRRRFIIPDIVLPKYKKMVIFVHGCFWHRHKGCKDCTTPTHRREWWLTKLNGNAKRDKLHRRILKKLGWKTIVTWECKTEGLKVERLGSHLYQSLKSLM